ncbi:MAG: hypothetical protein R6U04_00950 [Bacteroidales bacterium]
MKNFRDLNFEKLHQNRTKHNVTVYISASEADPETKENQNRIKLKNKIKTAGNMLMDKGFKKQEAEMFLKPAYDLIEDSQLLRNLWGGLILFLNEKYFDYFNVENNWDDAAYAGEEFYLSPVIESAIKNRTFFVLLINLSGVQLYKADQFNIEEVNIEEFVPENFEEAIGFDYKDRLYQHVSAHTPQGQTFYHGHAEGEEEKKEEVRRFLNQVDKGLMDFMRNKKDPLLVASVDYIFSAFREMTNYKFLVDENISISPKESRMVNLHEKGLKIMEKIRQKELQEDIEKYQDIKEKTDIIEEIVLRALQGRISTLFVNKQETEWGIVDEDSFKVKVKDNSKPMDKELLNYAVINTYFTAGTIHFIEPEAMPDTDAKLCGIYRY